MYFIILLIGPDHVTTTPTNGSAMLLSCASRLYHVTIILHCHWREFWSHDTDVFVILSIISIKNEKLFNSNNERSKPKFHRLLWNIVDFRLVMYLLNMILLNLLFLYKILYIYRFRIYLTQFYINFLRQEHQIKL